ncbi:sporulation initiation inhibitor protein soj [Nanobdella aerobiophila]|uniref:Sporulation initiation inhibitor protein soj n=1 Tax=Nanobdella aerobiophila TaxID=2586965 RepID=A0A915SSA5_9ARCH|nr:ParA family protein [Nanobdella aerobiophila]BBL45261.1 sporulation initiation inhibitor protein soj [Nanobdella aerobiophila]
MIISFISLKGGVGKTTLSINLGAYLKKFYNYKVLLIDTNGKYSQNLFYLKENNFYGNRLWNDIKITPFYHLKIIDRLPETYINDINYLKRVYDIIIFDVFPNPELIIDISRISDIIFLVINPDFYSLYVNRKLYNYLEKDKVKIVVNKYDKSLDLDFISEVFEKDVYCAIPMNKDLSIFQYKYAPISFYNEKSKALNYIDQLSYLVTGKRIKKGIFSKIFG